MLGACGAYPAGLMSREPTEMASCRLHAMDAPSDFYDPRFETPCSFRRLNGINVCVPTGLWLSIGGVCNPAPGLPNRIWATPSEGCDGASKMPAFIFTPHDHAQNCAADLSGLIVRGAEQPDQRVYVQPEPGSCEPSVLSAGGNGSYIFDPYTPDGKYWISEKDLATIAEICQ